MKTDDPLQSPGEASSWRDRDCSAAAASSAAQQPAVAQPTVDRLLRAQSDPAGRILLRGGIVLSLDPKVGDFEKADVLIEGRRITAIGPNLSAAARSAVVVDATDRIVMPGFVDTHHHQYETLMRSILADGLLRDEANNYGTVIQGRLHAALSCRRTPTCRSWWPR